VASLVTLAASVAFAQEQPAPAAPGPAAPATAPPATAPPATAPPTPPTAAAPESAAAQPAATEPEPAATPAPPAPPGGESPKRALPDYDGRGEEPTTAGDVALWIPRILVSPIYLLTEYVIRRPLGWLISTAEKDQWPAAVRDFFVFGPDKKAGIVPTFFLDLGFRPSVGIYAFWDDLLGPGNHLRLHFSTFGPDWLQGAVADKIPLGKGSTLDFRFEGVHRPDQVFHGLGPNSRQADRSRYGIDRLQARPVFESTWWKGSRVTVEGGVRYVEFRDDACCTDPSVPTSVGLGRFTLPPGFNEGYTEVYERGELTVDTRDPRPVSQTGLRLELEGELGSNVRRPADNWFRYGGSVGGFVDLKSNRTVSLAATALFVDPVSSGAVIAFTEQIVLGGSGPMRGYLYGRLIDRSAAVATLKYRWPIWVYLDGSVQAAVGNVFGPQLEDFKTKLLRLSTAIGVESVGTADHTFEVLFGLGTETFESGANVNSVRLVFGTNRGF